MRFWLVHEIPAAVFVDFKSAFTLYYGHFAIIALKRCGVSKHDNGKNAELIKEWIMKQGGQIGQIKVVDSVKYLGFTWGSKAGNEGWKTVFKK